MQNEELIRVDVFEIPIAVTFQICQSIKQILFTQYHRVFLLEKMYLINDNSIFDYKMGKQTLCEQLIMLFKAYFDLFAKLNFTELLHFSSHM